MRCKPKRASARWMEGAPPFVLSVSDNKGRTCDRYTVWLAPYEHEGAWYVPYLAMSGSPTHPQGVSMFGELAAHQAMGRARDRCRWLDLPEHIRTHVVARWNEGEE